MCLTFLHGGWEVGSRCQIKPDVTNVTFFKWRLPFYFIYKTVFNKEGHKYLFSEMLHTWQDAKSECELSGGFLLNLKDISEQNCLLRYAQSQNLDSWYWTDGKASNIKITILWIIEFWAHTEETAGVFVHSFDHSEVDWFGPKWNCGCYGEGIDSQHRYTCNGGGDAYLLSFRRDRYSTGAWCDYPSNNQEHFICEGII